MMVSEILLHHEDIVPVPVEAVLVCHGAGGAGGLRVDPGGLEDQPLVGAVVRSQGGAEAEPGKDFVLRVNARSDAELGALALVVAEPAVRAGLGRPLVIYFKTVFVIGFHAHQRPGEKHAQDHGGRRSLGDGAACALRHARMQIGEGRLCAEIELSHRLVQIQTEGQVFETGPLHDALVVVVSHRETIIRVAGLAGDGEVIPLGKAHPRGIILPVHGLVDAVLHILGECGVERIRRLYPLQIQELGIVGGTVDDAVNHNGMLDHLIDAHILAG